MVVHWAVQKVDVWAVSSVPLKVDYSADVRVEQMVEQMDMKKAGRLVGWMVVSMAELWEIRTVLLMVGQLEQL